MSEQELEQDHGSALSFLDTEEEEYEDSEHGTALIVAGFVGAIPLIGLAEWLGLGMPGFVGGALLAGIGVATAPLWTRYLPALGFDWHVLLQRVSLDDDAHIVESTIKPLARPDEESKEDEGEEQAVRKEHLILSPTLKPHVNMLFGSRVGIFGIPGSGKSNTIAVLLEELGEYECPLLVLDTENENAQLCTTDYFLNPNREDARSITIENAYTVGQAIMEYNLQMFVNLQSYATDEDAAEVMMLLVEGINDWEEAQSTRVPCAIVLDEASKWLPQQPSMSTLNKNKQLDGFTILQKLQRCFLGTVASRGRKRGMGLIFASQRLAMLNKNLIMCEWLFLLRQTLPNDLKTYQEMGCPADIAQKLENGQAFVITPTKDHAVHQIRMRFSESGANTPGLAELEEYRHSRSQTTFTRPSPDAQIQALQIPARERVNEPLEPVNDCECNDNIHDVPEASVNAVNTVVKVSGEHRELILKAIIAMQSEGLKVTRTGLRDFLKWNNRQYEEVLKPALDDMGLLQKEGK